MSHEATIKDLQQEQSRLREKIVQLEEEKDRLQSQSQALDEQQRLQILNLEKVGHFVLPVLALFIDFTRFITTGALPLPLGTIMVIIALVGTALQIITDN